MPLQLFFVQIALARFTRCNFFLRKVETTAAILLRKTRFSDTSLIITWLSTEHGKLKTIAKGALQPKSRFAGTLDLFYSCEIAVVRSQKSDLHTLRESVLVNSRESLRRNYHSVALAAYFVELLDLVIECDHPVPELHDLLTRALFHLEEKSASQRALLHFESELARLLGIENPGISPIAAIGRSCHQIPTSRVSLMQMLPETWA